MSRWWACERGHRNDIPDNRDLPFHTKCSTCPDRPTVAYRIEPLVPANTNPDGQGAML